jgi:hypothetical protein
MINNLTNGISGTIETIHQIMVYHVGTLMVIGAMALFLFIVSLAILGWKDRVKHEAPREDPKDYFR